MNDRDRRTENLPSGLSRATIYNGKLRFSIGYQDAMRAGLFNFEYARLVDGLDLNARYLTYQLSVKKRPSAVKIGMNKDVRGRGVRVNTSHKGYLASVDDWDNVEWVMTKSDEIRFDLADQRLKIMKKSLVETMKEKRSEVMPLNDVVADLDALGAEVKKLSTALGKLPDRIATLADAVHATQMNKAQGKR
jgi:hypothetical protein